MKKSYIINQKKTTLKPTYILDKIPKSYDNLLIYYLHFYLFTICS